VSTRSSYVDTHDHVDGPNGGYDITVNIDKTQVVTFDNNRREGFSFCNE
jgi:hypothetical protein